MTAAPAIPANTTDVAIASAQVTISDDTVANNEDTSLGEGGSKRRRGRRGGRRRRRGNGEATDMAGDSLQDQDDALDEVLDTQAAQPEFDFDDIAPRHLPAQAPVPADTVNAAKPQIADIAAPATVQVDKTVITAPQAEDAAVLAIIVDAPSLQATPAAISVDASMASSEPQAEQLPPVDEATATTSVEVVTEVTSAPVAAPVAATVAEAAPVPTADETVAVSHQRADQLRGLFEIARQQETPAASAADSTSETPDETHRSA